MDYNIPTAYMMANRMLKHFDDNVHYRRFVKPVLDKHNLFTPEQALVKAAFWGDTDAVDIMAKVMKTPDKTPENKAIMLEMNALGYDSSRDVTWALYKLRKNYFDIRDSGPDDNAKVRNKRVELVQAFQELSAFDLVDGMPSGRLKRVNEERCIERLVP